MAASRRPTHLPCTRRPRWPRASQREGTMSVSSVRWHIAAMAAVVLAGASVLRADPQPAGPRTIAFSIRTPESAVTLVEVPRPEQGPLIDVQLAAAEPTARAAEPG